MENNEKDVVFGETEQVNDTENCTVCEKSTEFNIGNTKDSNGFVDIVINKIKKLTKKQLITGLSLLIGVIVIVSMISYFNSVEYIEKKLTSDYWYQAPDVEAYYGTHLLSGSVIKFYLNGESELIYTDGRIDDYWYNRDKIKYPDWEIMDDKTLYFNGKYYTWREQWHLSAGKLVIGDESYSTVDNWHYTESERLSYFFE